MKTRTFFSVNRRIMLVLSFVLLGGLLVGCQDSQETVPEPSPTSTTDDNQKGESEPLAESISSKNIGIGGGDIEITDPDSQIFGVKVRILENTLSDETTLSIHPVQETPNKPGCIVESGFRISSSTLIKESSEPILIVIPFKRTREEGMLHLVFSYNLSSKQWDDEPVIPLPSPEPGKFFGTIYSLSDNTAYFPVICDLTQMITE